MKMRTAVSYQAVVLMAAAVVAATGGQVSAETVATGDGLVSVNLDAARGVAREATIAGIAARGPGGTEVVDHTPAPPADEQALPPELKGLHLPEGAPDEMHTVYQADDGPVREVSLGWLSGDRYLWRVELARALAEDEQITVYLDADHDPSTGRQDFEGVELMLQVGPGGQRAIYYMADGRGAAGRRLHAGVDGRMVHLTYDYPLRATDDGVACRVCVAAPDGRTPMAEVAVPLSRAASVGLTPQGKATAEPAVIRWERRSEDGTLTLAEQIEPHERYLSWKAGVRNQGDRRRWLDLSLALPIAFEGEWSFFDGFNLRPHLNPAADTIYSATSAVFPLTCVYADRGLAIALNPWTLFSELHAGVRVSGEANLSLLGSRIVVDPGASEELEFVLFGFDGSLGWRGAISKYWELFPEAFERASDIDPRFHMTSSGGLYWSFSDPEAPEFSPDLIRRMHAGWEWGYAPAPRPGEWAVTERSVGEWTRSHGTVKKSLSAERLPEVREYVREKVDGDKADVAVAYYMHLKYVEKGLVEKYFADSLFDSYSPVEYVGYYQFVPCLKLYPYANAYGDYLREAIPMIAESFGPRGFAFDSVFGAIPHHGPSALGSPGRSFVNGRIFVCEGLGFAMQMNIARQQHVKGYRTAMVTNLKLPTLAANAVRTDTALIEHHPTGNPAYLERFQRLRLLAGRKMMVWWHSYEPKYFKWIPWDELDEGQTLDAFRRLRDDLLIHSMYCGALPNARFLSGVPKLIRAVPLITEISALGWEPVIAARGLSSPNLLVSRYGSGLGMCYGLANQGYEPLDGTLEVDLERVGDTDLAFMDITDGGGSGETEFAEGKAHAHMLVPVSPRDVRAVRAVLSLPAGTAEKVVSSRGGWEVAALAGVAPGSTVSPVSAAYLPGCLTFDITCPRPAQVELAAWLPPEAVGARMSLGNGGLPADAREGSISTTISLASGENRVVVSWQPRILLRRGAMLDFPFVADGKPNCQIVATEAGHGPAKRIMHFFREYHLRAAEEPTEVKIPIATPAEATAERRVWVGLRSELPDDLKVEVAEGRGAFGRSGNTVYAVGDTPELLDETVKALLFTLDEKYVYWGPFSARRYYFRGEPGDEDLAVIKAGVAGGVLEGPDTGSLPNREKLPTLPVFQ